MKLRIVFILALCLCSCSKEVHFGTLSSLESQQVDLTRNLAYLELQEFFPDVLEAAKEGNSNVALSYHKEPVYDSQGRLCFQAYSLLSDGVAKAWVYTYVDKSHAGVVAGVYPIKESVGNTKGPMMSEFPMPEVSQTLLDSLLVGFDAQEAQMIKDQVQAQKEEESVLASEYWRAVEGIQNELEKASDQQLQLNFKTKGSLDTFIRSDVFILDNYNTPALFRTRWRGGCGPSALANAYRGLYTHYNGVYLPLWGDEGFEKGHRHYDGDRAVYNYKDYEDPDGNGRVNLIEPAWVDSASVQMDNGLYAQLSNSYIYYHAYALPVIPDNWAATLPTSLATSFYRATKGEYYLGSTLNAHEYLRTKKLPLICLKTNLHHYFCAIGSRYDTWQWEKIYSLFGKTYTYTSPRYITKKWLLLSDNGTDSEAHDFLPFWFEDKLENILLHMAIKKNPLK